jgi:type I restriction enzyme, S subunit
MEENQVYIPDGWHLKQVQEFAVKMRSGGTPKSDNPNYYNGEIPFVAIDDLTSANKYLEKTQKHITKEGLINSSAWLVPINSLMYSIYATLGVPRINLIEAATNQAILNLIPDTNKITLEFLYYLLLEKRSTILAHSAHTTQSNLNAKVVKELEFVFPKSTTEQTTIANILSKTDQAIADIEALITKYTQIKAGLMQDLLTKGIDENGNIRTEQTHEFKDSPLGRIPREWECEKLSDFCNEKYLGSVQTGPFGSQLHFSDYKNEGTPIITVEHLKNENISHQDLPLVGKEDYIRLKKYNLITGDLVFSRVGAIDRCSIVTEKENNWLFSGRCLRVRPGNQFNSEYLLRQMNFDFVRSQINNNAVGSTMKCLNTQILSDVLIVKPKITEQERIVLLFNKSNELISKIETELSKLQSLKTGLMQDLLTGKVRVKK